MTKLKSVIADVPRFTLSQNLRKEWGSIMATTIPRIELAPTFSKLSLFSTAILKVSIPAALGSALKPANTGTEITIVNFPSSCERSEDSVFHSTSS